jgi:hypothetical protein
MQRERCRGYQCRERHDRPIIDGAARAANQPPAAVV